MFSDVCTPYVSMMESKGMDTQEGVSEAKAHRKLESPGKETTMPRVLIQHQVKDYSIFERVFLEDGERRRRSGSKGGSLFRNSEDPDNLVALFEWDDVERARTFANSYELSEAVKWAGDATPPRVTVLEDVLDVGA
jgi:heme-degrading monooxygenase HmoA